MTAGVHGGMVTGWDAPGTFAIYTVRGTTCTEPVTTLAFCDVASGQGVSSPGGLPLRVRISEVFTIGEEG